MQALRLESAAARLRGVIVSVREEVPNPMPMPMSMQMLMPMLMLMPMPKRLRQR